MEIGYPNNSITTYKWDNVKDFIKNKEISLNEISKYKEMDQLRKLNNSFKHSSLIDESTKNKIPELRNATSITYMDIESFYQRVKNGPTEFLDDLAKKFRDEIYSFDDVKIQKMADRITYRMNENDSKLLIEKINSNLK